MWCSLFFTVSIYTQTFLASFTATHCVFYNNLAFCLCLIFIIDTAGNIRNLAMEKVAGSVLFPCRYVSNGCNATMPHTDKSSHEDGCEFRSGFSFALLFS